MRFKPGARKSLQQSLRSHLAAREFYAPPVGDPRRAAYEASIASHKAMVKPVRRRIPRDSALDMDRVYSKPLIPLERDVLKAVTKALRYDPRVSRVERNQSGVFVEGDRHIRVGTRGKLDLTVYLKSGKYMEIEIKRPGGKPDPRQAARIEAIKRDGGLAGYCWSIESALALLP